MIYRRMFRWGVLVMLASSFLSACGSRPTPTPIIIMPVATSVPAQPQPNVVRPAPTEPPPTEEPTAADTAPPAAGDSDLTTTPDGSETPEATATRANPSDLPFLMKIDRISTIVGRGTLLEGRVAHGTLQAGGGVEVLGPQEQVLDAGVLAILVSTIARDQITVGDYAGILVEGLDASRLAPGMLLTESGAYETYQEALQQLQ